MDSRNDQHFSQPVERYKKITANPFWPIEWMLAVANTLLPIGQHFAALITKSRLEHADLVAFKHELALIEYETQQRLKEELFAEIEYDEEIRRERLLKAWANSQLKKITLDDVPPSAQGIFAEIFNLLKKIGELTFSLVVLAEKHTKLNQEWLKAHQDKAKNIVDQIKLPLNLTDEKQAELIQALIPPPPALLFKLNPYLIDKVCHANDADNPDNINPICTNIVKMNDLFGELAFHALLDNTDERLMGEALLKSLQKNKNLFKRANVSFMSEDPESIAAFVQRGAALVKEINEITTQIKDKDREVKNKMEILHHNMPIPKLQPQPSNNPHNSEEETNHIRFGNK